MIQFDEKRRMFHLQTPNSSYIMRLYGEYILEHTYWGKRVDSLEGVAGFTGEDISFAPYNAEYLNREDLQKVSTDTYPQEYGFFGSADLRKPSFHAQYADGSRITKMRYVSHVIYPGKPKLDGLPATYVESETEADTLELRMQDDLTGLTLLYRYTAYNHCDAICRNVEVMNQGSQVVDLKAVMSCSIDFDRDDFDFVDLTGAWCRERHVDRRHLHSGTTKIESRRGASSHHHSPFFALTSPNADECSGDVYGFNLVYSGNFEAGVEVDTIGSTRAFMGINSFDFNWRLEPGEVFTAPEAVMVYSANGLGEMSRTYHRLYRKRLARGKWRDLERPVLINNWEATYFDFDEEKLLTLAECAKKADIEMLVLDDGWFGTRDTDTCALGDWYVNPRKLPGGISGLAQKVNDIGLKFGLWFEPEAISQDSDLYRAHPDWCLQVAGRGRSEGRHELLLDLSREDVQTFVIDTMTAHLNSANIEYIKWDMNRHMTCVGSAKLPPERQAEVYHRYMLGLYRVLETVTTAFPDVLFEGCSGGGGRFDAGQMHYFNQYWASDDTDAIERMYIQYGTSLVMPACFTSAHVSAVPNHQMHRTTSLKTRGYVAMNGQFGYELDITKLSDTELREIAEQIREYKRVREIIHQGNLYRTLSPFEGNHAGFVYVTEDQRKAVLFHFTIMAKQSKLAWRIKLQGLDPNKNYRLSGTEDVYNGGVLMHYGIYVHHNKDAESDMFVFEEA